MTPEALAREVRKATDKHPWGGAKDPRIDILWRALTVNGGRPPFPRATLQALAAGFAGAHGGKHVREIIDRVVQGKNHLDTGTHIPFLAGCLSEWPETQGGHEDRLVQQIEWILTLRPGTLADSCRREMLTALIREREVPDGRNGPSISLEDLDTILNAITDPKLEAATPENSWRVGEMCKMLLPEDLHPQVDDHFHRARTASGQDFKHGRHPHDTPPALKVKGAPEHSLTSSLSSMQPVGVQGKPPLTSRWVVTLPDGRQDQRLEQRASAIAGAICKELEPLPVDAQPDQERLKQVAKTAWRADDPPHTAGVVLQMLLQVLPKLDPEGLYAALRVLAHLPDPQPMAPRMLDSLVDALAISPHILDATAGVMMEALARELGGKNMSAPLRTCIANYLSKKNKASPARLVALEAGALAAGALARPLASTQSSSEGVPDS